MLKTISLLVFISLTSAAFGQLSYVEIQGTPFLPVQESTVTKLDADGDGDTDLIITGTDDLNQGRCDLFINNGNLEFSLGENTPFSPIKFGTATAGDVDGNGTMDVFISGFFGLEQISELYLNDGGGNFTLSEQNNFDPIINTHAVFFDAEGDDDLDLVYSGNTPSNTKATLLYLNDGNGVFTLDPSAGLEGLSTGDLKVSDLNNDGQPDIVMVGRNNSNDRVAKVYLNDNGSFDQLDTEFPPMSASSIELFDANGDDFTDVMLSGSAFGEDFTNLFLNNGDETFSVLPENDFNETFNCHSATVDIDNDGDLDLMISGVISPNQECYLYLNDGEGLFTVDTEGLYTGVGSQNGEILFEDFNGDGTPEFLITGFNQNEDRIAKLFELQIVGGNRDTFTRTSRFSQPEQRSFSTERHGDDRKRGRV